VQRGEAQPGLASLYSKDLCLSHMNLDNIETLPPAIIDHLVILANQTVDPRQFDWNCNDKLLFRILRQNFVDAINYYLYDDGPEPSVPPFTADNLNLLDSLSPDERLLVAQCGFQYFTLDIRLSKANEAATMRNIMIEMQPPYFRMKKILTQHRSPLNSTPEWLT